MLKFFLVVSSTHRMSRLPRHWSALLLGIVEMPSNIIRLQFLLLFVHMYSQDAVFKWTHQDNLDIRELPSCTTFNQSFGNEAMCDHKEINRQSTIIIKKLSSLK